MLMEWVDQAVEGMTREWIAQAGPAYGRLSWVVASTEGVCSRLNLASTTRLLGGPNTERSAPSALNEGWMYRLLGFCYSTGAFSSQEIARECHADPWLQRSSGQRFPFRQELVCFRRRNRTRLEAVLVGIFERVISGNMDEKAVLTAELAECLVEEAKERLDLARHLDSCDE